MNAARPARLLARCTQAHNSRSVIQRSFARTRALATATDLVQPLADLQQPVVTAKPSAPRRSRLKAQKAALLLKPAAIERLHALSLGPSPKLIRVGVRNKGCAGMSYHLEYVDKPERFDEVVKQDGVTVVIDSKALFSIIGSEMDWEESRLASKFVFNNPNIDSSCGCGISFNVKT